jgi:hypothetical protein
MKQTFKGNPVGNPAFKTKEGQLQMTFAKMKKQGML